MNFSCFFLYFRKPATSSFRSPPSYTTGRPQYKPEIRKIKRNDWSCRLSIFESGFFYLLALLFGPESYLYQSRAVGHLLLWSPDMNGPFGLETPAGRVLGDPAIIRRGIQFHFLSRHKKYFAAFVSNCLCTTNG